MENRFLTDGVSYVVGYPILRQSRVKTQLCKDTKVNKLNGIDSCFYDYGMLNEEKTNFDVSWTQLFANSTFLMYQQNIYDSFLFKTPDEIDTYPYFGLFTYYYSGGYVYKLNIAKQYNYRTDSNDLIINDMETLKSLDWIDQNTRSVYIEFTTFNPSIKLLSYNTILFEFLSTGTIIKSAKFNPIILSSKDDGFSIFILVINIIYLFYVIINMFIDVLIFFKIGARKYFSKMINFVEWIIYAFSITSFALYLSKLYETYSILDKLKSSQNKNGNYSISLQMLNYWNDLLNITLGMATFFSILKFLTFMKIRKISKFLDVLRLSFKSLFQFSVIFLIVFVAFAQLFYMVFNTRFKFFSTMASSLETCFLIILGSSPKELFADGPIGYIIYFFFNLTITLILVNLFIMIVSDSFEMVKRNDSLLSKPDGEYLLDKVLVKVKKIVSQFKLNASGNGSDFGVEYTEIFSTFKIKFLRLIDRVDDYLVRDELYD